MTEDELFEYYESVFLPAPTAEQDETVGVSTENLYYLSTRLWPSRNISVCWETTGFDAEKGWVREVMTGSRSWSAFADVNFVGWGDCTAASTGIRITPGDEMVVRNGLGTQTDNTSEMELDFTASPETRWTQCVNNSLSRADCIRAVALHEFGHSLGFAHEQRRSDTPGTCTNGTSSGSQGDTTFGAWDGDSIMNYCSATGNSTNAMELSATDRQGAQSVYGDALSTLIMRYDGSAWETLDRNPATRTFSAGGTRVLQMHSNGRIYEYTGTPCRASDCGGWRMLDNNPSTAEIVATTAEHYQRHSNGRIFRYTGTPCSGDSCPGWQMLDNNGATVRIVAAGSTLYQLHNNGSIFRYTGTPCSGDFCPGWVRLDNNSRTTAIVAAGSALYQLHNTGAIFRYTGTPCSGDSCPGWVRLDNNSRTRALTASSSSLYQLHDDGAIFRYLGTPCSGDSCPGWERIDNNARTTAISATGGTLYQTHNTGAIFRYTGTPCSGSSCPGWVNIDNSPRSRMAVSGSGSVAFQLRR